MLLYKTKIKYFILLVLITLITEAVYAQTERTDFRIRYIINSPDIDTTFIDNTEKITDLRSFLSEIKKDSTIVIKKVKFKGTASPDGGYEFNVWLSENRLRTFKELVYEYVDIPDSIIIANVSDIPWDDFRLKVAQSEIPFRDEVLEIIDEGPSIVPWFNNRHIDKRLLKLKKLHKCTVWEHLKSPILRDLRFGEVQFYYQHLLPKLQAPPLFSNASFENAPETTLRAYEYDVWIPRIHLKSNLLGWLLLIGNAGIEIDIARHFSVNIPIYYSALDYFTQTVKFRTLGIQPAVRYWPRTTVNEGFFANVHGSVAYYNLAFGGKYRKQDHKGKTPAYGGGLGVGYRIPIGGRWHMEFEVGVGAYKLDYDLFDNINPTIHGQLAGRKKMIYFGPDQASVSFTYSFDLKPKYRKRRVEL